jgi:hypothetical protein
VRLRAPSGKQRCWRGIDDGPMMHGVELTLADERLFVLAERLSRDEAQDRAMEKRTSAVGGGFGGLLQRPKPDDVTLGAVQRRLEPFWHVSGHARYEYERSRSYSVPAAGPEVRSVNVNGSDYLVGVPQGNATVGSFALPVREHCVEELRREHFTDGRNGQDVADGAAVITGPKREVGDTQSLAEDDTIVVAPEQRASFVVRSLIQELTKAIQADQLIEESVVLETADLYYRPIWAFEFRWVDKNKSGVVEIDAISGAVRQSNALLPQIKGIVTNKEAWFDIGIDTVELFVPGGNIAIKVARVVAERNKRR